MGTSFSKAVVAATLLPLAEAACNLDAGAGWGMQAVTSGEELMAYLHTKPCDSLQDVTGLNIKGHQLGQLPQELVGWIKQMTNLISVDFNGNHLTSIPEDLFNKEAPLHTVELQDNDLTALPIGFLADVPTLHRLNLNQNSLTSLPDGILGNSPDMTEIRIRQHIHDKVGGGGDLQGVPTGMVDNKPNLKTFEHDKWEYDHITCPTLGEEKTGATCEAITGTTQWAGQTVWVTDPVIAPKVWTTGSDGSTVYKCDDSEPSVCLANVVGTRTKWVAASVPDSVTLALNNTAFTTSDGSWVVNEDSMRFTSGALSLNFPFECACN